ncbi:MAG: replication initiation protein [Deinococcota bacterium]|nr:replication initiation protein [Deinococcota bacterium]
MSLLERRILLLTLAVLRRADTELPYVRIYSSDVRRAFDLTHNSLNTELNDASGKLMTRYAEFLRTRHGSNSKIAWVNEVHFTSGKDSEVGIAYIDVQLHPRMAQYVLQLTGNFFRVPFSVLAQFRSIYSMRLCEILTAESQAGRRSEVYFELEDLKRVLDCDKPSYKNFSNFRQRVLEPAKTENGEVGYLDFAYKMVKRGRAVVGLQFSVTYHPEGAEEDQFDLEPTEDDVRRLALENAIREAGFTDNPKMYIDKLGLDAVDRVYREARKVQAANRGTKSEIKNFGGFLHARLKTALELPTLLLRPDHERGLKHLTGSEIQAIAEELVQELARERTATAWHHWETSTEPQRAILRKNIANLDQWTRENIQREGETGPSFKGAVRRVLEDSGFEYSEKLRDVKAYVADKDLRAYPGEVRKKIIQVAIDID